MIERERRREPREPVCICLEIPIAGWEQLERLYTTDLSRGGTRFVSPHQLPLGARLQTILHLPDGQSVAITGEVRHARQAGEGMWTIGVRFLDVSVASVQIIGALLDQRGGIHGRRAA